MKTTHPSLLAALLLGAAVVACGQSSEAASGAAPVAANVTANGVNATNTVDSWGGGYCTNITLANTSTSPVTSWTLVFAMNGTTLNNIWGGTGTVSGASMTIKPVDYDANIAPGASVTLGFCGTGSGTPTLSTLTVVGGDGGSTFPLTVSKSGDGSGTVLSTPAGIDCGSTCSASFSSGAVVTLTASAASGSVFTGWSGACSGVAANCAVAMGSAQTAVASFGAVSTGATLTVVKAGTGSGTVTSSGGINCGSTCAATFTTGATVTLTASAASGSTFAGWSSTCPGFASGVVAMNASCAATATFNLATDPGTAVSVNAGGAASGTFVADAYFSGGSTYSVTTTIDTTQLSGTVPAQAVLQSERYGEFTYTIPNRTPGSAQTVTLYFDEVYWTAAGQRTFNVAINGAPVLTAFDIFASAGGVNKAIARTFNATADASGQVVIAFTKGGGPDNPKVCGITIAGGSVNTVQLSIIKAGTGTGTVTGAGMSCGATCSGSFTAGTVATLTATAASESTFAGWSGACTGTSTCTVSMTTNQTVTATFNSQVTTYALTVTRSGTGSGTVTSSVGGISCGSACSANIASGTAVTLTATAASGSTFGGWSNGCTGTSTTCTVSMTAARAVTATFNAGTTVGSAGCGKASTITFATVPGESGTSVGVGAGGYVTIQSGGTTRGFALRLPDGYDRNKAYPLIFGFHWNGGTAKDVDTGGSNGYVMAHFGLQSLSKNGAIFVAPQGLNNGWANSGGQDLAFVDNMVKLIEDNYCVDTSRIFTNGFSYGGGMSYEIACARAKVFRGAAIYEGAQLSGCDGGNDPIALWQMVGLEDNVCTMAMATPIRDRFVKNNACTVQSPPQPPKAPPYLNPGGHVCTSYSGCSAGHPVRWCVHQSGHGNAIVDGTGDLYNSCATPPKTCSSTCPCTWVPGDVWSFFSAL